MMNLNKIKQNLLDFKNNNEQLKIVNRKIPKKSNFFFNKLFKSLNSVTGFVTNNHPKHDIKRILNQLSIDIKYDPFFEVWLDDMSKLCKLFCEFLGEEKISYWVGSQRGCKRYHVDMVPFRLLVTYFGEGTELLPDYAADRSAFIQGKQNNEILNDKSALKHLNNWDIAIFRGGENGILHRTPDSALENKSSILMRLDNSSFLDELKKIN